MKLDRNITSPRRGKYALIKLRGVELPFQQASGTFTEEFCAVPIPAIDFGDTEETDFFVIRLKDKFAAKALRAYAIAAEQDDATYANEIHALADKAEQYVEKRMPD